MGKKSHCKKKKKKKGIKGEEGRVFLGLQIN